MKLRLRRREEPDVSLTPLIDVVFLLLIFFMVTTTFRKEGEFDVELPEASNTSAVREEQSLTVAIDAAGFYQIGEQRLPDRRLSTLSSAIESALNGLGGDPATPVLIRADGQTPHRAVVRVLDAASQLGLQNVGVVALSASIPE
jgi:biopolymer transport protein ExbD